MSIRGLLFFLCLLSIHNLGIGDSIIQSVSASAQYFNPSGGETVAIRFQLKEAGTLDVYVLDRDGFLVRTLSSKKQVDPGKISMDWNGKDYDDEVVPDEAYSFKINFSSQQKSESFFPANSKAPDVPVRLDYYDRRRGIVSYHLSKPARVHLQAAIAPVNPKTRRAEGPVLKTIVNRAVRAGGNIVEFWNGFNEEDESIYVPDHPHFKIAVAATGLPPCSVIAVGNREKTFQQHALKREGKTQFSMQPSNHRHHEGLFALDDVSPQLSVRLENGSWLPSEKIWVIKNPALKVSGKLDGPGAALFARQPGRLWIFFNEVKILDLPRPDPSFSIDIPLRHSSGDRILTLNWISEYGPVAVNALRFRLVGEDR